MGELKGNPLGLFDIHGNVWEWVQDEWEPNYYRQFQEKPALDPGGPSPSFSQRVFRGGNWPDAGSFCRASVRFGVVPTFHLYNLGFRVALTLDAVRTPLKQQATSISRPKSSDYRPLFNGRDLSQWEATFSENCWSVDDQQNALVGSAANGKKHGNWLFSDDDFSDFRLRLEFRLEPESESGIALRTPPVSNVKDGRMAVRLTNKVNDPIPSGTFVTWSGGVAHPQSNPQAAASLRPATDWNTVEIDFRDHQLIVTINGQKLQDMRVDKLSGKAKRTLPDCCRNWDASAWNAAPGTSNSERSKFRNSIQRAENDNVRSAFGAGSHRECRIVPNQSR